MHVLGNAGDEQGLEVSQGLRSEDRILGPSPAQLCTADITSHLFWQWRAFFQSSRDTDAAALPACEHALQSLPWGKPASIAHKCNRSAQEWNLRNIYPKAIVSSGLLELLKLAWAQLIVFLSPQDSQSIILASGMAGEHIPWAAARVYSWGDGFLRVTDPLASTQL